MRLGGIEGRHISSKSASGVQDRDEGVAGKNGSDCIPQYEAVIDWHLWQINDFFYREQENAAKIRLSLHLDLVQNIRSNLPLRVLGWGGLPPIGGYYQCCYHEPAKKTIFQCKKVRQSIFIWSRWRFANCNPSTFEFVQSKHMACMYLDIGYNGKSAVSWLFPT